MLSMQSRVRDRFRNPVDGILHRGILRIFIAGLILFTPGCIRSSTNAGKLSGAAKKPIAVVSSSRDPALDRLFRDCGSWIGGDSADSVPLGGGRILWLFGDSYFGSEKDGHRTIQGMIRNTVAIQQGTNPITAHLDFFAGADKERPRAFFQGDRDEWVWPCRGGIRTSAGLYIFLPRFRVTPGHSGDFGFEMNGMILAKITNPNAPP